MLCNGTDTSQKVWYMEPQSAKYCFSIVSSVLILQHVTEPLMLLYTLPDDTVCNIATNSDNVTVNSTDSLFWFLAWVTWSTGDWSFRHCALGVGSGCLILIMSNISLIFSRSVNFDAIVTKMDRSLLDKKSFFRMLGFFSFTKIESWILEFSFVFIFCKYTTWQYLLMLILLLGVGWIGKVGRVLVQTSLDAWLG